MLLNLTAVRARARACLCVRAGIYKGKFDNQGRPDGEGKMVRESDGRVVHEGQFKEGQPSVGWVKWMFG